MGTSSDTIGQIVDRRHRLIIEPAPHHTKDWGVRSCQTFGYLFQGTYADCVKFLSENIPVTPPKDGDVIRGKLTAGRVEGAAHLNGTSYPEPIKLAVPDMYRFRYREVTVHLGPPDSGGFYAVRRISRLFDGETDIYVTWTNPKFANGDPA